MTEDRRQPGRTPQLLALPLAAAILVSVLVAAGGRAPAGSDRRAERVLGVAPIPAGNPQTPEKVELGRLLFFDPRVMNGSMACASCHDPTKGWSDGLPRSRGPKGELGRNSLSLFNAAYEDFPSWDGSEWSIEQHSADAMKFFEVDVPGMVSTLGTIPEYRDRFGRVFGGEISFDNAVRAMAAFERGLLSFDTPYDRFRAGHPSALTRQQQDGMALFMGRAGCSSCHTPPLFTDTVFHALGVPQTGPQAVDLGRFSVTGDERDRGAFRTPTLRNVALTAPYMHDGVLATLDDVIAFYDRGGGPVPGRPGPEIGPLRLGEEERKSLAAFLAALTDATVDTRVPALPAGP
jgi:cytochrome c peroxidase